jgi:capsular exopolysaccharide synthesis family protein
MELEQYLRILRTHWLAVLVATLLGAGAAWGWSATQAPVYAASSAGFVTAGGGGDPGLDNLNDILSKSRAASYVVLATDRETASIVIDDLGLDTTPGALAGQIEVTQPPDTVIIQITARAGSAEGAQQLADAWVAALAERVSDVESSKGAGSGGGKTGGMRIEVSESAELPTAPVSPNVPRNVGIGALLGALLGFGYAVARSILDRRIRSEKDVEEQAGVAVVGTIPDVGPGSGLLVSRTGPGAAGHAAEGYRRLRTNLSYMDVDHPPRAIVITSPKQGDGKSMTAANLAAAIALSGQKVTLVDADLRRPHLARMLTLDDSVGLTDVLASRLALADAIQQHPDIAGLRVLTSGSKPPNPSELLGSQAMRGLVATLAEEGMVVIDAPPLLPVTDAAVLGHAADGALLTVAAGVTVDHELQTALGHLETAQAKVLGVVLNRVSRKTAGSGYHGYYGYDADS